MAAPPNDYDSPWKEALEHYLPDFLKMFLPELHEQINWSQPPVFLDKELQAITRDATTGRRIADKLVLVRLCRNEQHALLLLIHIEIQGGYVTTLTFVQMGERMYRYYYRISDHYLQARIRRGSARVTQKLAHRGHKANHAKDAELFSLCVLTASTGGPPALTYQQGFGDYGVKFSCPVVNLAQWLAKWDELERLAASNPFAVVVMAQLMAQQTRQDDEQRLASKTRIVRLLYQYNYKREHILQLFRLIDWMMALPLELESAFGQAMEIIEQEHKMAFVTSIERLGQQKGIAIGMEKGLLQGEVTLLQRQLARKFGPLPEALQQCIQAATPSQLETWSLNILDAETLEEVFTE